MLKKRIMSLLGSTCILLSPCNIAVNASTPLKATQVIENNDNKNIEIHNNFENFIIQNEKDKVERIRLEKQKQEELKRIKEQNIKDTICYYNTNDLRKISGISVEKAHELLSNTTYNTWEDAQAFVNAEKLKIPVNAIFLIGLCNFESYYGQSDLSKYHNNIVSWRLEHGWRSFSSKTECINETAKLLSNEYLNPNGRFFKGVSIDEVGIYYCEGNIWANKVRQTMYEVKINKFSKEE